MHAPSAEEQPRLRAGARDVAIGALAASGLIHAALVPQHLEEEPLLGAAFAAAVVSSAAVAYVLTRPRWRFGPMLAAALFAALLVAYPLVDFITGASVHRLDVMTKVVEAVGLIAALRSNTDEEPALAPVAVVAGILLGFLLFSVGGGEDHHTHAGLSYSTVTVFARLRGWSTLSPRSRAIR